MNRKLSKKENIKEYYKKKAKNKIKQDNINKFYIDKRIKETYQNTFGKIYITIISRMSTTRKEYSIPLHSYEEVVGCDQEQLKTYIMSKFTEGMTLENHGEWEVDHIIPVSSFDFTKFENYKKCFHYTNLQPLWKEDNRNKGCKIIPSLFDDESSTN